MDGLDYISNSISSDDYITNFDLDGDLELEYRYDDLQFIVSDQLKSDGYFAVTMFTGRDRDTNSHLYEREFSARTARGMARIIKREAKAYTSRYDGLDY
jgi:hypothetical protein